MTGWLYDLLFISPAGWWIGGGFIYLSIAALALLLIPRYGGVTMGPDPVIPLSEATTVEMRIEPARPIGPNYTPEFSLDEYYPLAEEVEVKPDPTITAQLRTVAAFFERTETVTVTREVVIAVEQRGRHRDEDVHAETHNLTEALRRAKELTR